MRDKGDYLMSDTQLDRIEKMLKILIQATTTIEFDGTDQDNKELAADVKKFKTKKEV